MDASYCDIFAVRFAPESKESGERIRRIRGIRAQNPKNPEIPERESEESGRRIRRIQRNPENPKNPGENPKNPQRIWRIPEAEFKEAVYVFFVSNTAGVWHRYHLALIHHCMTSPECSILLCSQTTLVFEEHFVGMLFHLLSELIVTTILS